MTDEKKDERDDSGEDNDAGDPDKDFVEWWDERDGTLDIHIAVTEDGIAAIDDTDAVTKECIADKNRIALDKDEPRTLNTDGVGEGRTANDKGVGTLAIRQRKVRPTCHQVQRDDTEECKFRYSVLH